MIEIHAGRHYSEPLDELLREAGARVVRPLEGVPLGGQLGWYGRVLASGRWDAEDGDVP